MSRERYTQPQPRRAETNKAATITTGQPESTRLPEQEQPEQGHFRGNAKKHQISEVGVIFAICPEKSVMDEFHILCCAKAKMEEAFWRQMRALTGLSM